MKPNPRVTRDGDRYTVRIWAVDSVLDADQLRTLIDSAIAALGETWLPRLRAALEDGGCELDDVCEHPHDGCGPGCDGWGNG